MSRRFRRIGSRLGFTAPLPALLMLLLMLGCERETVTSAPSPAPQSSQQRVAHDEGAPSTAPAPDPAQIASTQSPDDEPATQPRGAHMLVGVEGRRVEFPPAKLLLKKRGDAVHAVLYSDDPPEAMNDDYTGNSFYIEMTLDVSDPQEIATARWIFKAPSSERADTISGIFLDGRKQHFQPFDVVAEFHQTGAGVKVWLSGRFLRFDSDADPTMPGELTPVAAELEADLTVKL